MRAIKQERLDFRLGSEQKDVIQQAADLMGHKNISSFAISTLVERSREIIEQYNRTKLSVSDAHRFIDIVTSSEEPNDKLKSSFRKFSQK